MQLLILSALSLVPAVTAAAAPPPRNAKVETRAAGPSLAATVADAARRGGTTWVGWSVPGIADRTLCCSWNERSCRLEDGGFSSTDDRGGGGELRVLVKTQAGAAVRIRPLSASCDVDARGASVVWLEGVTPAQSVAWLGAQATADPSLRGLAEDAMAATAFHDDAAADELLARLAGPGAARERREKAAFWLGVARGAKGFEALARLTGDPDAGFREELTFAVSRSEAPGALETLVRMARRDPDSEVRGKALFWLGQRAGERARGAIDEALENDPETEVKTQAVFALSQLPPDEGIPALIRVAETHKNAAVREKALFWLGHSGDPRALDYFEKLLTR